MKDAINHPIQIGDDVIYLTNPGYKPIHTTVIGFTKRKVKIITSADRKHYELPSNLVVITDQIKINKQKYPEEFV